MKFIYFHYQTRQLQSHYPLTTVCIKGCDRVFWQRMTSSAPGLQTDAADQYLCHHYSTTPQNNDQLFSNFTSFVVTRFYLR